MAPASDPDSGTLDALQFSFASDIVELVVLSRDESFLQTLRDAVGGARRLWHVLSAEKVSDLLVAGEVGIVVLDVAAMHDSADIFVTQIKRQFPDLVVVVAGNRSSEIELAALISAGTVYRFIHKPMSPGRARMFVEAAVRRYGEQRQRAAAAPARAAPRHDHVGLILAASVASAVIVAIVWALSSGTRPAATSSQAAAGKDSSQAALLARAAAALAAGRLTVPVVDSALELYLQASARNPADPRARAGLADVRDRLLARAENALLEERLDEAAAAIETARRSGVEGGRTALLAAQLGKLKDQIRIAHSRAAVKTHSQPRHGGADEGEPRSLPAPPLTDTRDSASDEREQEQADVTTRLLQSAAECMQQDRLIEPANDSAKYYLLAARASEPDHPGLRQALQELGTRLLAKARLALTLEQYDAAASWIEEAAAVGYSSAERDSVQHALQAALEQRKTSADLVSSTQLTLLKSVQPAYPPKARSSRTEGWIELDFTVGTDGAVQAVTMHAASAVGVFDEAAIKAVSQWRYKPVLRDNLPTAVRTRVRIRFSAP